MGQSGKISPPSGAKWDCPVNRLVNVETKDEETLLANIQQAQNVLFTRYKKNQINSNDDLSEIAYQINVFIKCLQTLPTEDEE